MVNLLYSKVHLNINLTQNTITETSRIMFNLISGQHGPAKSICKIVITWPMRSGVKSPAGDWTIVNTNKRCAGCENGTKALDNVESRGDKPLGGEE